MTTRHRIRSAAWILAALSAIAGVGCRSVAQQSRNDPGGSARADSASMIPATNRRLRVFLLIGQSNMAGRGRVDSTDRTIVPKVWMLDSTLQWRPAIDPMHFDRAVAGVGPGRAFGVALAERDPATDVGLVPAAVGGTSIAVWAPGAQDPATRRFPYDDAIRRARVAMQRGELAGIIWHQGESDATPAGAARYEERLRALIARVRADLETPDVPFMIGQVGRFPERAWNRPRVLLDSANRRIVETVPGTALVSSAGLTHRGDTVHFDSRSARELGRRYAARYLRLVKERRE